MFETRVQHKRGKGTKPVQVQESEETTRTRLLEAAGEVFARSGFKGATVREICGVAGVNIASVNYHFGGKERLYSEALRYVDELAMEKSPPFPETMKFLAAEEKLRVFIRQFLVRVFDDSRPAWHEQLLMREMVEPTSALDDLVERNIRPRAEALQGICREIIGTNASRRELQRAAASVVGQCLFYWHCRPMIGKLMPEIGFEKKQIESIAEHVTNFSLHALRGMAAGSGGAKRKGRS